jgi:hypothetical protein
VAAGGGVLFWLQRKQGMEAVQGKSNALVADLIYALDRKPRAAPTFERAAPAFEPAAERIGRRDPAVDLEMLLAPVPEPAATRTGAPDHSDTEMRLVPESDPTVEEDADPHHAEGVEAPIVPANGASDEWIVEPHPVAEPPHVEEMHPTEEPHVENVEAQTMRAISELAMKRSADPAAHADDPENAGVAELHCSACGHDLHSDARFCSKCGSPVGRQN